MVPGYSFVAYRKFRIDIDSGIKPENVPDQFPKTNFHAFINGNIFSYLFLEQPFLSLLFLLLFFVMYELQCFLFLIIYFENRTHIGVGETFNYLNEPFVISNSRERFLILQVELIR